MHEATFYTFYFAQIHKVLEEMLPMYQQIAMFKVG